jgi:chromosome partitioning protein
MTLLRVSRIAGSDSTMKVLAMVAQKGGTGKTTLAASLAVAAQADGEQVFCIDLDPQGSLADWGAQRAAETPAVDRSTPDALAQALTSLTRAGYTLAIIDTAGVDSAATAAAMRAATLALIPARPSILDIKAARPTMAALERLGRQFAFVLNQCPPGRTMRPDDASKALRLLGVLAHPHLAQRADHLDAIAQGLGVTEFAPEGKAAEEVRQLWAWAKRTMEGTPHGKKETLAR